MYGLNQEVGRDGLHGCDQSMKVCAYNTIWPPLVMLDAVEVQVRDRVILPVLDPQEDLPGAVQVQPLLCEGFKCLLSDKVDVGGLRDQEELDTLNHHIYTRGKVSKHFLGHIPSCLALALFSKGWSSSSRPMTAK